MTNQPETNQPATSLPEKNLPETNLPETTKPETTKPKPTAPVGDLSTYAKEPFRHGRWTHDVYRKGDGPVVIVITELPGLSPMVLGFADRLVAMGCSVALPNLFGEAGRDPLGGSRLSTAGYVLRSVASVCISREFTTMATGRSSAVIDWLRELARAEHERCGGPGVGVVGMCFTGGFALAMATDPRVVAPVLSQPSLPCCVGKKRSHNIDASPSELATVKSRCDEDGLRVLGLRFNGDPFVPADRFVFLREQLGDGFVSIELDQADGNPANPMSKHHSVLTGSLIDEAGEPTRAALDDVLDLFRSKLLEAR